MPALVKGARALLAGQNSKTREIENSRRRGIQAGCIRPFPSSRILELSVANRYFSRSSARAASDSTAGPSSASRPPAWRADSKAWAAPALSPRASAASPVRYCTVPFETPGPAGRLTCSSRVRASAGAPGLEKSCGQIQPQHRLFGRIGRGRQSGSQHRHDGVGGQEAIRPGLEHRHAPDGHRHLTRGGRPGLDAQVDPSRCLAGQLCLEILHRLDRMAVNAVDDVAGLDAGACRGAVRLHVTDDHALHVEDVDRHHPERSPGRARAARSADRAPASRCRADRGRRSGCPAPRRRAQPAQSGLRWRPGRAG